MLCNTDQLLYGNFGVTKNKYVMHKTQDYNKRNISVVNCNTDIP